MRKPVIIFTIVFLILPFVHISSHERCGQAEAAVKPSHLTAQVLAQKNLPLEFIPNAGQTDRRVSFYIKGSDRTLYFTPEGITLALHKETRAARPERDNALARPRERKSSPGESCVLKMDFIGARKDVVPEGLQKSGAVFSYFKGSREDWHTGLPGYRRIIYRDLWPGVDLVYKGDVGRLKYEFLVRPGADPSRIRLGIRGATAVAVDKEGRLVVDTPLEKIIDEKPLVYQEGKTGARIPVKAAYKIDKAASGSTQVGFSLADFDRSLALVIDPATFVYCGFIGGSFHESGRGIAVDVSGCAYIAGTTFSSEATFPVREGPDLLFNGGEIDAFVAKVNASGSALVYCGYIGGGWYDEGSDIAVDGSGCAYVAGTTRSDQSSLPVVGGPDLTFNGYEDAFVAKVNASGTALVYCGYIGGLSSDTGNGIALDGSGCAYICGNTHSDQSSFPVVIGPDLTFFNSGGWIYDAYVAKVKADGTGLVYCGYIGGSGDERGHGIAVDASGCAYVTGYTQSDQSSFPVVVGPDLTNNGYTDAYVAKVNASGSALVYCGYIGGSLYDECLDIAVNALGCAYVTGHTSSDETTFPVMVGPDLTYNGGDLDAFVAKVKADGTGLVYCGYIGGDNREYGVGVAVDGSGGAYIAGITYSDETTFPVVAGPDLIHNEGGLLSYSDAFVARVNELGTGLVYCGYIGGSTYDEGYAVAVDGLGSAYVTGYTLTLDATFPVKVGPDLTYNGGHYDAFVAKVAYTPPEMFADLVLSKSVDNLKPYVDDAVIFTVTVANLGPDDATGVAVKDLLPAGLTLVSASASQGAYDQATGLWTVGAVNDGATATLTLRARVDKEGTITNTATTAGLNETDRNALNNTASATLAAEYRVYAPSSFTLQRLESDLIFSKEYINRLTWTANPLNKSVIVSYRLYRKAKAQPDSAFALYKEFASSVTSFDDRGLKNEDLFTYRLTSVNDKGKESFPTEAGN